MMHLSKQKAQSGQAVFFFILGLTFFLLGAVGLGIDGAHLYAQYQMAQAAADAAAEAGIMSLYDSTNVSTAPHYFNPSSGVHTCAASDAGTPCYYAQTLNGFNSASTSDTVTYEPNPSGTGISNLSSDPVNLLRVTVSRAVPTTLMRLLGPTATTVSASGTAAILTVLSPMPIVVLHPSLAGAFSKNGSNSVIICGGPTRSIQVNSKDGTAVSVSGNSGSINLSHAGPLDSGNCVAGTGASFGNTGGPTSNPTGLMLGTLPGSYLQPDSPITDPLINMPVPPSSIKTTPIKGGFVWDVGGSTNANNYGCPSTLPSSVQCRLYSPGYYDTGIQLGQSNSAFAVFRPGIYYINHGGFQLNSNSIARMAGSPYNTDPTGITTWTSGMLIYNSPSTPVSTSNDILSITANSGQIQNITYPDATQCGTDQVTGAVLGGNCLVGAGGGALTTGLCASSALLNSVYYGTLFFQDRTVVKTLNHSVYGGGGLTLKGTIYAAHTSTALDGTYQSVTLQGNGGSTTTLQGQIIVDALTLGGTSSIAMDLSGLACYKIRQVALVQ